MILWNSSHCGFLFLFLMLYSGVCFSLKYQSAAFKPSTSALWQLRQASNKKRLPRTPIVIPPEYEYHYPVMIKECCEYLNVKEGGVYVDCTMGGGGHSRAILERGGKVIGLDQDPDAVLKASAVLQSYIESGKFEIVQTNFRNVRSAVEQSKIAGVHTSHKGQVDGVLMDLGVSSYQINEGTRGFSFGKDGPLDMRMNKGSVGQIKQNPTSADTSSATSEYELTAADIINEWGSTDIANLLYNYGDEVRSRKIAREIVTSRPLYTTGELEAVISKVTPMIIRPKTLARCFQALRIAVNDELGALHEALTSVHHCIRPGGRLVVMSYHSLEDRKVKQLFRSGVVERVLEDKVAFSVQSMISKLKARKEGREENIRDNNVDFSDDDDDDDDDDAEVGLETEDDDHNSISSDEDDDKFEDEKDGQRKGYKQRGSSPILYVDNSPSSSSGGRSSSSSGGVGASGSTWQSVNWRVVVPSAAEVALNRRARSARLRAAEKVAGPGDWGDGTGEASSTVMVGVGVGLDDLTGAGGSRSVAIGGVGGRRRARKPMPMIGAKQLAKMERRRQEEEEEQRRAALEQEKRKTRRNK
jgi:16S rRNA (cytosine1402-N4)-methyltransferase